MKILHIVPHVGSGGDWVAVKELTKALKEENHEVMFAGDGTSNYQQGSVEVKVNRGLIELFKSLSLMKQFPKDIEIIHAHSPLCLFFGYFLKVFRIRKSKLLMTYHWDTANSFLKILFKKVLFSLADDIHCYSIKVSQLLREKFSLSQSKVKLIYFGVDSKKFRMIEDDEIKSLKKQFKVNQNDFVYLYAGRLNPEKNIEFIIKHIASKDTFDNQVLLIAGNGPLEEKLKSMVSDLKISERVIFLGRVNGIEKLYPIADLLILPSTSMETFGFVIVEAALCGVPSLRSDLPGAEDQIKDGENGFIYPYEDYLEFSKRLNSIYENRKALEQIGKSAGQHSLKMFTVDIMKKNFISYYKSLIS